jgi:alkylation response protein AidB-like acyl-CoA dehydrogenase
MVDVQPPAQFALSAEQREIGALAREFAAREIAPHITRWDREHVFPRELLGKLGTAGLMGLTISERFGGAGADYVSYALALEELAKVDAGTAVTLSVHLMIAAAIGKLGDSAQQARWLPRLASGAALAGFALTEPDAGSDASALRSSARRDGESWLLRGRKQWCTNGGYAAVSMAMFRTGGPGSKGVSAFLIDHALPGVVVEKVTEKLGIHTSNTVDLAFDDMRLPDDALLGGEGQGLSHAHHRSHRHRGASDGHSGGMFGGKRQVCQGARSLRQADRCLRRHLVQDRAHGHGSGSRARAGLSRGGAVRPRRAFRARSEPGQTLRFDRRAHARIRSPADSRRLRLHDGVPRRALLSRREDHRNLRRHKRDPTNHHRPRAARTSGLMISNELGIGGGE